MHATRLLLYLQCSVPEYFCVTVHTISYCCLPTADYSTVTSDLELRILVFLRRVQSFPFGQTDGRADACSRQPKQTAKQHRRQETASSVMLVIGSWNPVLLLHPVIQTAFAEGLTGSNKERLLDTGDSVQCTVRYISSLLAYPVPGRPCTTYIRSWRTQHGSTVQT